jgi:hypothetical protein
MADFDVRGEHQDADVGQFLVDHSGGVEPLGGSGRRYPDVDHHQFGPLLARQRNKVCNRCDLQPW